MIRLFIGNPGSGKTLCAVREMHIERARDVYTNIRTRGLSHVNLLNRSMFIKKEIVKTMKKRDGTEVAVYDVKFNQEFWVEIVKKSGGIDIVVDEAHILFEARAAMSRTNRIMGDFLALSRKIMGSSDGKSGRLTLITQIPRRLDIWCQEMARQVRYHRCHYTVVCRSCRSEFPENNDMPEQISLCPSCGSASVTRKDHIIEVWYFIDVERYQTWRDLGRKTYFRHVMISDIGRFFGTYETYQFNNLFSE